MRRISRWLKCWKLMNTVRFFCVRICAGGLHACRIGSVRGRQARRRISAAPSLDETGAHKATPSQLSARIAFSFHPRRRASGNNPLSASPSQGAAIRNPVSRPSESSPHFVGVPCQLARCSSGTHVASLHTPKVRPTAHARLNLDVTENQLRLSCMCARWLGRALVTYGCYCKLHIASPDGS
ncbi:hypothetical protein BU23DRAFT_54287 [Bimuria novae-zelandiae CBS 107.79]|uniref:Uncharacterized protein n=1 Tax=Bimuria novae-zelandiae CBS 107.79 TaxID=1447943 RepID=A0A6A5UU18_9PLEO|nr:hypothetical protein BU23DRAFT_54287 [Bimuria novae-zelandiae CBS 107.79]